MDDLISRQAVMDATKTVMKDTLDSLPTTLVDGEEVYDVRTSELDFILNINKALQNAIKLLPSANRSGKWIERQINGTFKIWRCNKCGWNSEGAFNYCPNCGARMKGGDNETD